jgi:peptide/nickel transport system permease protein
VPEPPADPTLTPAGASADGGGVAGDHPFPAGAEPGEMGVVAAGGDLAPLADPEVPAFPAEDPSLARTEVASPEAESLLYHQGQDLELHSDFEADVVAVHATLPGRSSPGSKRPTSLIRRLGWTFWIAVAFCVVIILAALFASLLPLSSPTQSTCVAPNTGPVAGHLLGCDDVGRDVLSRVVFGSQVSLVVGFASIALALLVGGAFAVVSGYLRGIFDSITGVFANVLLAYPYLVLGLAIVTFWGHSEFQVTVVIAIVAVAPLYRVVRANTIAFAERDYVLAAMALGSTRKRILWKQIIPDVIPTAITYALIGVALAVVGEGALSYLGQSVPPNTTPTWGNMIAEGSGQIPSIGSGAAVNIWIVLGPAIAMFLFILAINLIGDRLRTILDVREGVL